MRALALALCALASAAQAREVVTLKTRDGVTQSFFIAGMGERKAEAVALLFIGGGGYIRLRVENGQPRFNAGNFLPRSRLEFIRNGILPVIMEVPSDQQAGDGMTDDHRASDAHVTDVRAVIADVRRRYPGLPVFLVGTSKSTLSMAHLGRALGPEVEGVVLSSSLFRLGRQTVLATYDFSTVKTRLLFVHHRDDACHATPYADAAYLGRQFPLISVRGGKPPESGPCDPLAAHGFFGKEAATVDAIAAWMLNRPFPKDVE